MLPEILQLLHQLDFVGGGHGLPMLPDSAREQARHAAQVRLREAEKSGSAAEIYLRVLKEVDRLTSVDVDHEVLLRIDKAAGGDGIIDSIDAGKLLKMLRGEIPDHFVHPAHRALMVHEFIMARNLFGDRTTVLAHVLACWLMRREGYGLFDHLELLRFGGVPRGNDAAALRAWLERIRRAIKFLRGSSGDTAHAPSLPEELAQAAGRFNSRQQTVLAKALQQPGIEYTMESHQQVHQVAYATARADLYELRDAGLLIPNKRGKAWVFSAAPDLRARLASHSGQTPSPSPVTPPAPPPAPTEPRNVNWRVW